MAGAPVTELDLLRQESDVDRTSPMKLAAVAAAVCAVTALLILILRIPLGGAPTQTASAAEPDSQEEAGAPIQHQQGFTPPSSGSSSSTTAVIHHSGSTSHSSQRSGKTLTASGTTDGPPPVTLQQVILTVVPGPNGSKQVMGSGVVHNGSSKQVLDCRAEVLLGSQSYSVKIMKGRPGKFHEVSPCSVKPGEDFRCGFVSQDIAKTVSTRPSIIRLQAWLDGVPGSSVYDYPIQN